MFRKLILNRSSSWYVRIIVVNLVDIYAEIRVTYKTPTNRKPQMKTCRLFIAWVLFPQYWLFRSLLQSMFIGRGIWLCRRCTSWRLFGFSSLNLCPHRLKNSWVIMAKTLLLFALLSSVSAFHLAQQGKTLRHPVMIQTNYFRRCIRPAELSLSYSIVSYFH